MLYSMTHPSVPTLEVQQGTTWRDGKLYYFHPQFIEVLRIWPKPQAWRKDAGGTWQHVLSGHFAYDWYKWGARDVQAALDKAVLQRPAIALGEQGPESPDTEKAAEPPPDPLTVPRIQGDNALRRKVPDWRVCQAIPPRVGACLSGLGGRGWHLLTLLARVPEAVELAESNRAVAWILASSRDFRKCAQPMRRARRLVLLPRHDMLGELGWPKRKAVVRLLGRLTPNALDRVAELLLLRDRCHDADFLREAGHLPVVTRDVLRLMADVRIAPWATPALWREVAALPFDPRERWPVDPPVAHLLTVALDQAADLGVTLPPVTSLAHLDRLRNELRVGLARLAKEKGLTNMQFGPPPLPPPSELTLEPLTDFARLTEESERMHHCIASPMQRYVRAIQAGTAYAWHVAQPKATVFVERSVGGQASGRWQLAEVKGFCNQPVPAWLRQRLQQWLATAQGQEQQQGQERAAPEDLPDIDF